MISEKEVQILPPGNFRSSDGRPKDAAYWVVDSESVLSELSRRTNDVPIYYEHQDVHATDNGLPSPAAGWVSPKDIRWSEKKGLYAVNVQWTPRAQEYILLGEYRFTSAFFSYEKAISGDAVSGRIIALHSFSLVNSPAIDGMEKVTLKKEGTIMNDVSDVTENEGLKKECEELRAALVAATKEREELRAALAVAKNASVFHTAELREWAQTLSAEQVLAYAKVAPPNVLGVMQSEGKTMPLEEPPLMREVRNLNGRRQ